ncbi:MAG TPA: nuclear transport factor 2 family protein, partial [Candidatus Binataceae bacterium]|nr:nuclear transport factor 2 family protein [Candidatus Binataceae bacterium]
MRTHQPGGNAAPESQAGEESVLTVEQRRERARKFLENFNAADAREFEELIAENFTFEIVSAMKEFPPIKGRREFAEKESATLRALFPQGLGLVLDAIICEGEHVAALAHCDTVANN